MDSVLYASVVVLASVFLAAESVTVKTKLGDITGKVVSHTFREKRYATEQFLGIPYAKPPTGKLRFQRPEPHGAFAEPLKATEFGASCLQKDHGRGIEPVSEDCLFLNIFAPHGETKPENGSAVMVFIHGGGFNGGSSALLPAHVLSAYGDVIVVSMNYRLGLFGFANTGDDNIKGNMGLWDQRLAIQWVNEHIEAFGGDPSRITIFGESAGSVSAFMQGMYPPNNGLFRHIIAQSGAPTTAFQTKGNNMPSIRNIAKAANCSGESADEIFTCLYTADVEVLMSAMDSDALTFDDVNLFPSIDGEFLHRNPLETVLLAHYKDLPEVDFLRSLKIINGINSAEGTLLLPFAFGGLDLENLVVTKQNLHELYMPIMLGLFGNYPQSVYPLFAHEYTNWEKPYNAGKARQMFVKFLGDMFFNVPGAEFSLLHVNKTGVKHWLYNFDARLGIHLIHMPSWVDGANHADELLPVFGYAKDETEVDDDADDVYNPPDWELDLSERMMTFWSNFAKYGDPNGSNATVWPAYNIQDQTYLTIAREDTIGQYLHTKEVEFWRHIVPYVAGLKTYN